MFSFPKDLAQVIVGPRVGRRYGDFVARDVTTAGIRGAGRGGGECTMVAAPPALLPLVRGTPSERRPGGSTGLGLSLLATTTRLQMVALHSSSFPVVGGKSRSNCARAKAFAGVG